MTTKTKKSASKRFKVTATGKLLAKKPGYRHFKRRRSTRQKRAARTTTFAVSPGMAKRIKKAMPLI